MTKKGIKCPRCHKPFKTRQGLGNHLRFCNKIISEKPAEKSAPEAAVKPTLPSPDKAVPPTSGQWNPSLPESEKELIILNSMPVSWGIRKRWDGKWAPVPMAGTGLNYEAAAARADKWNVIERTRRLLPRRRRREPEDDGMDELLLMMLLAMTTR